MSAHTQRVYKVVQVRGGYKESLIKVHGWRTVYRPIVREHIPPVLGSRFWVYLDLSHAEADFHREFMNKPDHYELWAIETPWFYKDLQYYLKNPNKTAHVWQHYWDASNQYGQHTWGRDHPWAHYLGIVDDWWGSVDTFRFADRLLVNDAGKFLYDQHRSRRTTGIAPTIKAG